MQMISRPTSITIIGWWLILSGLYGAFISATLESNPFADEIAARSMVPLSVQEVYGFINGFVIAGCGIGFLKGIWWSRLAYLLWSLVGVVFGFFISPGWIILYLIIFYGIVLSVLCRRSANMWFEH
jgi:hypothetical protein